jgi:hypothetical protein
LSHRLNQCYKAFTSKDWPFVPTASEASAARQGDPRNVLGFVTRLSDPNHSILIRALLDRESLPVSADATDFDGLSAGPSAYAMVQDRMDRIREETALKFLEFRDKWRKRLTFIQLHPFLQRNQWFQHDLAGYSLVGKGTRKEAKMLYLQSLHDMASDGERQVSAVSGHMFRLQGELAAIWHRESVKDDRSKLLPALEATLRQGEAELFKRVRLSLGDLAMETFMDRVQRWDKRIYGSEEEMFRGIAWPWQNAVYRNGFDGFMEAFADLAEAICETMIVHYEGKWDLFLRGLTPLRKTIAIGRTNP